MTLLGFLLINQFGFQTARKRQVEKDNAKVTEESEEKSKLGKVLGRAAAKAEQPSPVHGQRHLGLWHWQCQCCCCGKAHIGSMHSHSSLLGIDHRFKWSLQLWEVGEAQHSGAHLRLPWSIWHGGVEESFCFLVQLHWPTLPAPALPSSSPWNGQKIGKPEVLYQILRTPCSTLLVGCAGTFWNLTKLPSYIKFHGQLYNMYVKGDFTVAYGPTSAGAQSSKTWAWETAVVLCLF